MDRVRIPARRRPGEIERQRDEQLSKLRVGEYQDKIKADISAIPAVSTARSQAAAANADTDAATEFKMKSADARARTLNAPDRIEGGFLIRTNPDGTTTQTALPQNAEQQSRAEDRRAEEARRIASDKVREDYDRERLDQLREAAKQRGVALKAQDLPKWTQRVDGDGKKTGEWVDAYGNVRVDIAGEPAKEAIPKSPWNPLGKEVAAVPAVPPKSTYQDADGNQVTLDQIMQKNYPKAAPFATGESAAPAPSAPSKPASKGSQSKLDILNGVLAEEQQLAASETDPEKKRIHEQNIVQIKNEQARVGGAKLAAVDTLPTGQSGKLQTADLSNITAPPPNIPPGSTPVGWAKGTNKKLWKGPDGIIRAEG